MSPLFRLLFFTLILFGLSACVNSNIEYNNRKLTLQTGENILRLEGTPVKITHDSYGSLFIRQTLLRLKEGNLVVYEDARTDLQYEFEKGISQNIKIIFDAKQTYIIYAKHHLYGYQLLLKNGKILNVIALQDDTQRLKMVYGMNIMQFNNMLKSLDTHANQAYYKEVLHIEDVNNALQSRWNTQKVHFVPLVSPLPRMLML